ncbi:hypothetical protein BH10ACI2_BH10ACI2_15210 [soil metagenome]
MTTNFEDAFDFEVHEYVLHNLRFLDEILVGLNASPILSNPDFLLEKDSSGTNGVNFKVRSSVNPNAIEMWLLVESWGIRLDIDGIREAFEWTNKEILESKDRVATLIKHLFTGYILVDTRRGSKFVQILDLRGFFIDSFSQNNWLHTLTGLYLWRKGTSRRLFLPFIHSD